MSKETGNRVDDLGNDRYRIIAFGHFSHDPNSQEVIVNGADLLSIYLKIGKIVRPALAAKAQLELRRPARKPS